MEKTELVLSDVSRHRLFIIEVGVNTDKMRGNRHFRGATPTSQTSLSTLPSKHSTSLKHSQQLLLLTSLLTLLAGSALLSY